MSEKPIIDSGREKLLALAEEIRFEKNSIVSRTVLRTPNSRTVLFGFAEGQELTEHTSTQHAMVEILTGECEFSLDGKVHELKSGDFVYVPPSLPHAVRAKTQFSMLLTLIKPEKETRIIDVDARGLEPPQPMVKILEALAGLPQGAGLRARTDRRPMHLYAQLDARGFAGTSEEQNDGSFITHIRAR